MKRGWDREDVDEVRKFSAQNVVLQTGGLAEQPALPVLLDSLKRNGPDQAILEAGLHLSEEEFATLEDAYRRTPKPDLGAHRRRRR